MKVCTKCNKIKNYIMFRKNSKCKNGTTNTCKECFKLWSKKYEKTQKGFLMRLYRNMKSRVSGVQKNKHHLYKGKVLLNKQEFYKWANESNEFYTLFDTYEKSNYIRKLAPSVDRVDSSKGYEIGNMEWVTMGENSRRGALSRHCTK